MGSEEAPPNGFIPRKIGELVISMGSEGDPSDDVTPVKISADICLYCNTQVQFRDDIYVSNFIRAIDFHFSKLVVHVDCGYFRRNDC